MASSVLTEEEKPMTAIHETMSPSSKNVRSEQLGEKQDQLISKILPCHW